jgi:hypothetical protein
MNTESFQRYLRTAALNNSAMDHIKRSPAHCRAYFDGELHRDSEALRVGRALHSAILEPEEFDRCFGVFAGDRRTNAGKAAWAEFQASGKTAISATEFEKLRAMSAAVLAHPVARMLIDNSAHEFSRTWEDECGARCKARADIVMTNGNGRLILGDLKSTEDASPGAFFKSIANFNYHRQGAFYLDGFHADEFLIVAVEKAPPYGVAVYRLPPHVLAVGRAAYKPLVALYQHCTESGQWPCYDTGITDLQLPAWAIPDDAA